ncbi:hypothetical protein CALVIDRAFT_527532 [Calocera viscosa TUFC12733]|uniref:Replication protein A OB domain-containing protein n=1 Tax=Calocera viscosa (strain TUFC12733) TaxID=1330018 RepID=A0A167M9F5_CALVF|nr:hypothetical protein CALVIDRAFT_527532 [Calocera viscosa TUFC12733]
MINYTVYGRIYEMKGPHSFCNQRSTGKVMTLVLKDRENNGMRVVVFDRACEVMKREAAVDSILRITDARIQETAEKFQHVGLLLNEIMLNDTSDWEVCASDHGILPMAVAFTALPLLRAVESKSCVNILAIVKEVGKRHSFGAGQRVASDGAQDADTNHAPGQVSAERRRLEVQLVDPSMNVIRFMLWDKRADMWNGFRGNVVFLKDVVVVRYGGVGLTAYDATVIQMNPKLEGVSELKKWWTNLPNGSVFQHLSSGYSASGGLTVDTAPCSDPLSFKEVLDSNFGQDKRVDTFHIFGVITKIARNTTYEACRFEGCNRSLQKIGFCLTEEHAEQPENDGEKRYCTAEAVELLLIAFSPVGDVIMGTTADEVHKMQAHLDGPYSELLRDTSSRLTWFKFTVQARTRSWKQNNGRMKYELQYTVIAALKIEDDDDDDWDKDEDKDGPVDAEEVKAAGACVPNADEA